MPYFIAILIIQSLNPRGEYYNILGIYLDKVGVNFTIIYFIRVITLLYFITIVIYTIKKIKIPNGKIYDEIIRINIFMKIIKKSFFRELQNLKKKSLKEKINLITNLIENVYNNSFRLYPYDIFIDKFRENQKNTN